MHSCVDQFMPQSFRSLCAWNAWKFVSILLYAAGFTVPVAATTPDAQEFRLTVALCEIHPSWCKHKAVWKHELLMLKEWRECNLGKTDLFRSMVTGGKKKKRFTKTPAESPFLGQLFSRCD